MGRRRMLGKSAAGSWTPAQLGTNWGLWLDAADSTTITQSGGAISAWADKSASGRDATQIFVGNRPLVGANLNSKPTISFNGSGHYMTLGLPLPTAASNEFYIFAVIVPTLGGSDSTWGRGLLRQYVSPETAGSWFASVRLNGGLCINHHLISGANAAGSVFSTNEFIPTDTAALAYWSYNSSLGATSLSRINLEKDAITATKSTQSTSIGWGAGNGELGRAFNGGGYFFRGRLAELVFVAAPLSINKERIEGYLAWKWGIEANLPIAHPYKLSPP